MATHFKELVAAVGEEARAEGPAAVAELNTLRAHLALGRQIVALRRRHKLTQKQLAALSGIGQSDISKIERAATNPTTKTLSMLAAALNSRLILVDDNNELVDERADDAREPLET